MIKVFRHKGLRRLFEDDDGSKLPPDMVARIRVILSTLQAAQEIGGMDVPTFRLHPLKGELKGFFSVTVRANWRIIFGSKMETLSTWILSIIIEGEKIMEMKNPVHPGQLVKECLEDLGLSVAEAG